jgi:hypothetical protein
MLLMCSKFMLAMDSLSNWRADNFFMIFIDLTYLIEVI